MREAVRDAQLRATTHADFDRDVAALAHAPTGTDLERRDFALLFLLGVLLPIALLIWGWA
jgi:hypothetical protein